MIPALDSASSMPKLRSVTFSGPPEGPFAITEPIGFRLEGRTLATTWSVPTRFLPKSFCKTAHPPRAVLQTALACGAPAQSPA
jgi:hypothetical protein